MIHANLEANNIDETHTKHIEYGKYNDKMYGALKEFNTIHNLGYSDDDLRDVSYKGTDINPSSNSYNESLKNYLEKRSSISGQNVEIEFKEWENRVFNLINTPNRNE